MTLAADLGRFERALRVCDQGAAQDAIAICAPPESAHAVVSCVAGAAPFLARLIRREASWLRTQWNQRTSDIVDALLAQPAQAAQTCLDQESWMRALRIARRRVALIAALLDIGGVFDLDSVTGFLSNFSDAAVATTVDRLLKAEAARGKLKSLRLEMPSFFVLAMGKLGARELNYSSDIDLICLFEPDRLANGDKLEAKDRFSRITRDLVRILSEITADGFVARVDLRLRPDPGATPPCISVDAAEVYYESLGRPWERAAHIKARPIAGDRAAANTYLERLSPFIWRRYLDFASIEDAANILAKIRAHEGGGAIAFAGQDIKLGAGGIREIEFTAQSEQIILGGRAPQLRQPRTVAALATLCAFGRFSQATLAGLTAAYDHLRRLEHRIQMIEDQQTHRVPTQPESLDRIAALMGCATVADLEAKTLSHMRFVRTVAHKLDQPKSIEAPPRTVIYAFPDAKRAEKIIENWTAGRPRALRTERAQERLQRLLPRIQDKLASANDPMRALIEFDRFIVGLPSGVQILSLFEATPWLVDLVTEICAVAPALSATLARRPALLDSVLDPDFFEPLADCAALTAALSALLARESDYESRLDSARRWVAERKFRIGVSLLRGEQDHRAAQRGYSDVAEAALNALWPHIIGEGARRYGDPPGEGAALVAMGKLGSREMTARSDLDLILIYDAPRDSMSTGPKPVPALQYYARFTQLVVSAITAPTAEGALYEIDMRLRPSGRAGPIATAIDAFERYQREDAWVWEYMALTRARPVAGAKSVQARVAAAISQPLAEPRDDQLVRDAARQMREKLAAANPEAQSHRWALKFGCGALVDIEFIAQTGLLRTGQGGEGGVKCERALSILHASGDLDAQDFTRLTEALVLQTALQQIERVAMTSAFEPEHASDALKTLFVATASHALAVPIADFSALEATLARVQAETRQIFDRKLGIPKNPSFASQ